MFLPLILFHRFRFSYVNCIISECEISKSSLSFIILFCFFSCFNSVLLLSENNFRYVFAFCFIFVFFCLWAFSIIFIFSSNLKRALIEILCYFQLIVIWFSNKYTHRYKALCQYLSIVESRRGVYGIIVFFWYLC